MSYGLLIRDAAGRTVVDGDTFTVRYITGFVIPPGTRSGTERFTVPDARDGMFAVCNSLSGYNAGFVWDHTNFGYILWGSSMVASMARTPALRVGDGWVEAFQPGPPGRWDGGFHVMVFTNI